MLKKPVFIKSNILHRKLYLVIERNVYNEKKYKRQTKRKQNIKIYSYL